MARETGDAGPLSASSKGRRRLPEAVAGIPLATIRQALEAEPDVDAAYVFGSQARGTARARSDVDVAVIFSDGLDPVERFERRIDLINKLEDLLGRPVDVVDMEAAGSVLVHQVLKDGGLLFERDAGRRVAVEVRKRREYLDNVHHRRAYLEAVLARLKGRALRGRP